MNLQKKNIKLGNYTGQVKPCFHLTLFCFARPLSLTAVPVYVKLRNIADNYCFSHRYSCRYFCFLSVNGTTIQQWFYLEVYSVSCLIDSRTDKFRFKVCFHTARGNHPDIDFRPPAANKDFPNTAPKELIFSLQKAPKAFFECQETNRHIFC